MTAIDREIKKGIKEIKKEIEKINQEIEEINQKAEDVDQEIEDVDQEIKEVKEVIDEIKCLLDLNWHAIKEARKAKASFKRQNALGAKRKALSRKLKVARKFRDKLEAVERSTKREQQVAGMNPAIRTGRNRNFAPHR